MNSQRAADTNDLLDLIGATRLMAQRAAEIARRLHPKNTDLLGDLLAIENRAHAARTEAINSATEWAGLYTRPAQRDTTPNGQAARTGDVAHHQGGKGGQSNALDLDQRQQQPQPPQHAEHAEPPIRG
jgi:hypothetical protein